MIPITLDILGTTFYVVCRPLDGMDIGVSEVHKRLIQVDNEQAYEVQVETFYHELVHTVLGHTGLSALLDEKTEEAICQGIGMALSHLISNNRLPTIGVSRDQSRIF